MKSKYPAASPIDIIQINANNDQQKTTKNNVFHSFIYRNIEIFLIHINIHQLNIFKEFRIEFIEIDGMISIEIQNNFSIK